MSGIFLGWKKSAAGCGLINHVKRAKIRIFVLFLLPPLFLGGIYVRRSDMVLHTFFVHFPPPPQTNLSSGSWGVVVGRRDDGAKHRANDPRAESL